MSSGSLILVAKSLEKHMMTFNPEITFFKSVYKHHTNFSIETIPQYFINPIDFGRDTTLNLGKNGDLINEIYLYLKLPPLTTTNHELDDIKIEYVKNLGYSLIKKVELEIGGIVISREYGEWLYIWNEINTSSSQKRGVDIILGNTEKYNKAETSKESLILTIPLYFWFNDGYSLSLPLVSMNKDDIKINIELRKLSEIVIQTPQKYITINENFSSLKSGDKIYQNINGINNIGIFDRFELTNNRIYYNPLVGNFNMDNILNNKITTDYGETYSIKNKNDGIELMGVNNVGNFFNLNFPSIVEGYCLVNYVFLDNKERNLYLRRDHQYLVKMSQNLTEESFSSNNIKYNLHLVHPVSSIYFRVILEDNIRNKNYFEYSKFPLATQEVFKNEEYQGNQLSKNIGLIKEIKLFIDGQPISNLHNPTFYTNIQNVRYFHGNGNKFIYQYSFSINPLDSIQPYGSINFSKIKDAYLQLTLDGIVNYQNPVRVRAYALNYNMFQIINGVGKMLYSL